MKDLMNLARDNAKRERAAMKAVTSEERKLRLEKRMIGRAERMLANLEKPSLRSTADKKADSIRKLYESLQEKYDKTKVFTDEMNLGGLADAYIAYVETVNHDLAFAKQIKSISTLLKHLIDTGMDAKTVVIGDKEYRYDVVAVRSYDLNLQSHARMVGLGEFLAEQGVIEVDQVPTLPPTIQEWIDTKKQMDEQSVGYQIADEAEGILAYN